MAGGRVRNYAAEYAKRIERAMQKGKTRQEARGHRPGEAARRREARKEREETGLYPHQARRVFAFATKRQFEIHDHDFEPTDLVDWAAQVGYATFRQYEVVYTAARKQYLKEVRRGTYASRGMGYLQMLADQSGVDELSWLYYH